MTQEESRPAVTGALSSEGASQETGSGLNQCGICEGTGRLVRTLERGEVSSDCGNCGGTGVLPARPAVEEGPRCGECDDRGYLTGPGNEGKDCPFCAESRDDEQFYADVIAAARMYRVPGVDVLVKEHRALKALDRMHASRAAADDPRDEGDEVEAAWDEFENWLARVEEDPAYPFGGLEGYMVEVRKRRKPVEAAIERRRGVAVPQAGTFTALEAARLAVGFGDGEDYCGSCGAHWRDIQNGCRLHPLWNVLASTEAEPAVQAGGVAVQESNESEARVGDSADGVQPILDGSAVGTDSRLAVPQAEHEIGKPMRVNGLFCRECHGPVIWDGEEWVHDEPAVQAGGGDEAVKAARWKYDSAASDLQKTLEIGQHQLIILAAARFLEGGSAYEAVHALLDAREAQAGGGLRAALAEYAAHMGLCGEVYASCSICTRVRALVATPQGEKEESR